jgi:glycerol kinase
MLFGHDGQSLGQAQIEHDQIYPHPGWVEHNPIEIWQNTQVVIRQAIHNANIKATAIQAIGVTNQRETTLVWDRITGKPYYNAIVWQDTRTKNICDTWSIDGGQDRFRYKTGLPLATYFSGPKLKWIIENVEGVSEAANQGRALLVHIDPG